MRVCRAALAAKGYEVLASITLDEASRLLAQTGADLVILDAAIPGVRVEDFCMRIGRHAASIILLAPPNFRPEALEALRPFAAGCLVKPFPAEKLVQLAESILNRPPTQQARLQWSTAHGGQGQSAVAEGASYRLRNLCGVEIAGCLLERVLGRGASGTVYLGRHRLLDVAVAVKVIEASSAQWSPQEEQRFIRGARAAAQIQPPNVAAILNAGVDKGAYFLVQRYIPGQTLKDRIESEGRLPPARVAEILRDIASGLAAVHRLGIVHRDVKPGNIILSDSGAAVLTDFGPARPPGVGEISSPSEIVDTPYCTSPEQCQGKAVDERSDLYSLGATAYHALTGRPPITGDTPLAVLRGHLEQSPAPPRSLAPDIPERLSAAVMRLLAKSPEARFACAEELLRALERA